MSRLRARTHTGPRNDHLVVEPPAGSWLEGGDLGGQPGSASQGDRERGPSPHCVGTPPITHTEGCPAVAPACGHPDSILVSGRLKFILEQFFFSFNESTAHPRLAAEYK